MTSTYDSLAEKLMKRYTKESEQLKNNQLFVCVAGGPGSGKSTLATAVAQRINACMGKGEEPGGVGEDDDGNNCAAVVLPMDGFHYSRAELRSMGESPDVEYTYEELIERRGSPWTFDAAGCVAAFTEARKSGRASLPVYSRVKSDPVPDGVILRPETSIVLLEGNYLLSWDDAAWEPLREVFDETWYIVCNSEDEQRERLVARHLETWNDEKTRMFGEGSGGAGAKADANDVLNVHWIEQTARHHADLVIESV